MRYISIDVRIPAPQAVVVPRLADVLRDYEKRGGVALSHDLDVAGGAVSVPVTVETGEADRKSPAAIPLALRASHHAAWFPVFRGQVRSEDAGPLESVLRLDGACDTPLGAIGDVADATVLGHAAERSLRSFLDQLRSDVIDNVRTVELNVHARETGHFF
jgi:hypothetical protein